MKISIISPMLSQNSLGRAYLLAKVLSRKYKVEIIGPTVEGVIWFPCNTGEFRYKSAPYCNYPFFLRSKRQLLNLISGDVIYASKLLPTSFGIGLARKEKQGTPLILDIDDWETGFFLDRGIISKTEECLKICEPLSLFNIRRIEKHYKFADTITTVSNFLKNRYGGHGIIVPHGRDTEALNPLNFNRVELRRKYGIDANKVITFLGTPRWRKGLNVLIKAVKLAKRKEIRLMIIGGPMENGFVRKVKEDLGDRIIFMGMQTFSKIPEFLSMADLVVIPQLRTFGTEGQVPAKIFDAMAMAKPIIATAVSDIPTIIDGCGWIINPGNTEELFETIEYVFCHPREAEEMGRKAREKCKKKYSWDTMENILTNIFDRYV